MLHEHVISHYATGTGGTGFFFEKALIFSENSKTGFFCRFIVGEVASILKYKSYS